MIIQPHGAQVVLFGCSDRSTGSSPRKVRETIWSVCALAATLVLVVSLTACGKLEGAERTGRVTAVIDGDTVVVQGIGTVRYIGIDTPELHHPRKPVQRLAAAARAANRSLVDHQVVRVEFGVEAKDVHGRSLGYVYLGDRMVNVELVRRGLARTLTIPPNDRYAERFRSTEREARQAGRGLWGAAEGGPPWGSLG